MLLSVNPFIIAYSQSDFFGKLIMLGLIALSMVCWVVLLHKVWLMRKVDQLSKTFQAVVEQQRGAVLTINPSVFPSSRNALHPFSQIFQAVQGKTIEILNKNRYFLSQSTGSKANAYLTSTDLELLESHASSTISVQLKSLEKNLFILPTIVTLAPFMGLLGTVWGILVTFSGLHKGESLGSSTSMLGGLSTALATTVLGLVIAIPALIAYNYIKNYLRHYTTDMDTFLSSLLSQIELQYRKVE